jgi:hypothetical protein
VSGFNRDEETMMTDEAMIKPPAVCPLMAEHAAKFRKCGCDYPVLWMRLPESLRSDCGADGCILQRITLASGRSLAGAFDDASYWSRRGIVFPEDEADLAMLRFAQSQPHDLPSEYEQMVPNA